MYYNPQLVVRWEIINDDYHLSLSQSVS